MVESTSHGDAPRERQPPDVPRVPPPWHLEGNAWLLALWLPRHALADGVQGLTAWRWGRLALVMFVDYRAADCGPYRELLFIPGRVQLAGARCWQVSRIYVSTDASAVNGRSNWGLPKERCEFAVAAEQGGERVRALRDGAAFADLTFRVLGQPVLVTSSLVPAGWRTLGQEWEGRPMFTTPRGSGRLRAARLVRAQVDPHYFPDFTCGRVIAAIRFDGFRIEFPAARAKP